MILATSLLFFGVTIDLPMEAHVAGTEITVGEVARIRGPADEVALVSRLTVGYAPAPGFSRLVWGEKLAQHVRTQVDLDVVVTGQKACRVWPVVDTVAAAELEGAARDRVRELVGVRDATFDLREDLKAVQIPSGDHAYLLRTKPVRGNLDTGVVSVPVEIHVDGDLYRPIWTSWDVEVWASVPVVAQPIAAGERIVASSLQNRRVKSQQSAGKALPPELLLGAVAARDLAPGETVTELDIHRPAVVTAGVSLFLEVRKGAIVARIPAVARQSGSIGDRIRVVSEDSKREMLALVVSQDLVSVEL